MMCPMIANASKLQDLEILNGTLSRKFEPTNNYYSVQLDKGETFLRFNYQLENDQDKITTEQNDDQVLIKVLSNDASEETYVIYINKEETIEVFKENTPKIEEEKSEIPHLKYYVGLGVLSIIILLFKILILGKK